MNKYNNFKFNNFDRINFVNMKISPKSKIKILNGVNFNHVKFNSSSTLKANLDVSKIYLPNDIERDGLKNSYNKSTYNNKTINKTIKVKFYGNNKIKFLNGVNFNNLKLNSNSRLYANLSVDKVQLPHIDRDNVYNDLSFNNVNRIKFANINFSSKAKLDDLRDNRSIKFFNNSKFVAVPKKINVIRPINADHFYFGGRYNNANFNRADRDQNTSISFKGTSKFTCLENSSSTTMRSSSYFKLEAQKISGFINPIRFNASSSLSLNPMCILRPKFNVKSSSNLKINPNKYMWSSVNFLSQSFLISKNLRVRFENIKFVGNSSLQLNSFIISEEILTLENLNFKPNDVITIDLNDYYITHNNQDITYKMKGNFFKFYPGENVLVWHDNVNKRNIKLEILYQNKFL